MKLATFIKASAALAMLTAASAAFAQDDWPNKPIRIISPNSPGGLWDTVARHDAEFFVAEFSQPWVIENRPGAGGSTAATLCTQAEPDGYTMCTVNHNSMVLNTFVHDNLPYKPQDLEPVVRFLVIGHGIVVNNDLPFDDIPGWRKYMEEHPGEINFGTLGEGSGSDRQMKWLEELWSVDMTPVPYPGVPEISQAIISGEIDMTMLGLGNFVGFIRDGEMKLIGVDSPIGRSPDFPDAASMAEFDAGFPLVSWGGYAMPKGTPLEIVDKMNAFFVELGKNEEYLTFYRERFLFPALNPRPEFLTFLEEQWKEGEAYYAEQN